MPANNIKIKESQYPELKEFLLKHSNKEASEKFHVHEGTIEKICRKMGLKKGRHFKHTKNENFFENIDSHDKAYLLGIMYSDGFVKRNSCFGLVLHKDDEELLHFFKEKISYSGPLKTSSSFAKKNQICLEICSKKICEDLVKLGCVVNKSLTLKWPSFLDNSPYVWSFILGVIDGDGHIQNYDGTVGCQITGAVDFCEGMKIFLQKNGIKSSMHSYKNPLTKDVRIYSSNAITLFSKLLENQTFSLKRKKQIMEYRIFCSKFLMVSNSRMSRGTFLKESLDLFKDGKYDELIIFVKNYHKETYKQLGEKAKTTWVNQFTSARQKFLQKKD